MVNEYIKDRVAGLFGKGRLYCAETVVKVMAEAGGRDSGDAVRMATGFCSGMARTCGQCGAVSGAVMGIGLFSGRDEPEGEYEQTYAMTQEFLDKFKEQYHSVNCYEICGCDFTVPEDQKRFKAEGKLQSCVSLAAFAVETALSILREHGYLAQEADLIKSRLAPCGLMCGKCVAFAGGPVQQLSRGLKQQLGDNFGEYAKRFEAMNPVFVNYAGFADLLDFLASGSCTGCREQGGLFQACRVADCVREHSVDYCFECTEFPCDCHGLPERLEGIWRSNNGKMQEIGVGEWFRLCNDKPRYP